MNAIYLRSIIQGQFSGWQLCGYNHQWWIILRGNSLAPVVQRQLSGVRTITGKANFWVAIIHRAIILRGEGGQLLGRNYLGRNCPVPIIVYREISVVSWNLLNDPKHRGSCGKAQFPHSFGRFAVMGLEMYLLTSSILFQKDSNYNCQFYTKNCAPSRLVSQVYVWAKYKDDINTCCVRFQSKY